MRAYTLLWALAIIAIALDQASKAWISQHIPFHTYGEPFAIAIIPDFFNLIHVGNTGAAWSLFSGKSALLAGLAAATLLAIFLWRKELGLRARQAQISFGLLCGGIAGNLIDRIWRGHVVDFLDFHFGSYVYPTFNIADSCICIGVGIYLWYSLHTPEKKQNSIKSS